MAFEDFELSPAAGEPVELYKLEGTFNTYLYTSHEVDIPTLAGTYTSSLIERTQIQESSQDTSDEELTLSLPISDPLAQEYAFGGNPPPGLKLTLYRAHLSEIEDQQLLFTGEVLGWNVKGRTASARVPSLLTYLFDNPFPHVRYQGPCNHVFGDERCGVDLALHTATQDVVSIAGNVITLDAAPFGDGEGIAGQIITAAGERRLIIDNVGTDVTVSQPFRNLVATNTVTLIKGCDHSFTTCKAVYGNGINFGGFPGVPDRNPFGGRL